MSFNVRLTLPANDVVRGVIPTAEIQLATHDPSGYMNLYVREPAQCPGAEAKSLWMTTFAPSEAIALRDALIRAYPLPDTTPAWLPFDHSKVKIKVGDQVLVKTEVVARSGDTYQPFKVANFQWPPIENILGYIPQPRTLTVGKKARITGLDDIVTVDFVKDGHATVTHMSGLPDLVLTSKLEPIE
jgi:hypothetical protein